MMTRVLTFPIWAVVVSVVCAVGRLYGIWGYMTIRLYIWELSVLETPRHINATESVVPFILLLEQQRVPVKPDVMLLMEPKVYGCLHAK